VDPSPAAGSWLGPIQLPGGVALPFVLHLISTAEGGLSGTADSPEQGAFGLPLGSIRLEGETLTLEIPTVLARFDGVLAGDTLRGSWTQGGASLPLTLVRTQPGASPYRRPQDPIPPFPYRSEEVEYLNPGAGIRLSATLTIPDGEGPFPAVVLISGSGPQNRDSEIFGHRPFLVLADHLSREGFAVLRSDDRGVGASQGSFGSATSADFATDAVAAASYLAERPEVDGDRIGLIGHSEGAIVALIAAEGFPRVAFLVLLAGPGVRGEELLYLQGEAITRVSGASPAVTAANRELQETLFGIAIEEEDPAERRRRMEEALTGFLEARTPPERIGLGIPLSGEAAWIAMQASQAASEWMRTFLRFDPAEPLARTRVPLLAILGELDLQVPAEPNQEALTRALSAAPAAGEATVLVLPGLNHLFQPARTGAPAEYGSIEVTIAPELLAIVSSWLSERAGARR
jgi:uncharacterized protein